MPREIGLGNPVGEDGIDGDIDFDFFEDEVDAQRRTKDESPLRNVGEPDNNCHDKSVSLSTSVEFKYDNVEVYRQEWNKIDERGDLNRSTKDENESSEEEEDVDNGDENQNSDFESDTESENSLDVTVTDSSSDWSEDDSFESLSDSDITDVTPLSSANMSPLPASPNRFQMLKTLRQRRKEAGVKFLDEKIIPDQKSDKKPPIDLDLLVQAILKMEQERKNGNNRQQAISGTRNERISSSARSKKNMSFSDDQVRKIDRENQLLLKKILDQQNSQKNTNSNQPRLSRPASSAINRLRQQKKIEAENLMLLKRIQSAKPTRELSRQFLLKEQKNCSYNSNSRCSSQSSLLKGNARKESNSSSSSLNKSQLTSRSTSSIPIPIQNSKSPSNRARVRSNRASEARIEWNSRFHSKS